MLVRGDALRQFDLLSADTEMTETLNVEYIIKGLALYFPPVNSLSKQNRAVCRAMKKPRGLKVRHYVACLVDLNEYLALFPGDNLSDKIGITKLNKFLLNIMPNSWYKKAYLQGFDCETIFLKAVNMFEQMNISEYIYEGVV